jgi:hypothetical protein
VKIYWLVIRDIVSKEAIGIDKYPKHAEAKHSEEQWLGPNGMHARLDKLLGRGKWTYSKITKAEWETFRDLHGFKYFGEE